MSSIGVKKITIIGCCLIIVSFLFWSYAHALDIPEDLIQNVNKATRDGQVLYNVYLKGPAKGDVFAQEINMAKEKVKDFCKFKYNAYVVNADEGNVVYFIAEPPNKKQMVVGRHYKIDKEGVTFSTVTCFVSTVPPKRVIAAFVTHLISDTPNEFHVFLSLKHKRPLYVITRRGIWKVELGKIEFSKKSQN